MDHEAELKLQEIMFMAGKVGLYETRRLLDYALTIGPEPCLSILEAAKRCDREKALLLIDGDALWILTPASKQYEIVKQLRAIIAALPEPK